MLQTIFFTILEISLTVSFVIVLLLILLPVFNKIYTAKWRYWVWLLLAVRLLIPFNPSFPQAPVKITQPVQNIELVIPVQNPAATPSDENTALPQPSEAPTANTVTLYGILSAVWAFGTVVFLLHHISGYILFRKSVSRYSRPIQDKQILDEWQEVKESMNIRRDIRIMQCKSIQSPMMTGFFKPVLLLPSIDFDRIELKIILSHELIHYKRKDIWYKLLLIIANAVHWFNPLIYYIKVLSNKDIEMVCDSEVVKNADITFRKQYGRTILSAVHKQRQRQMALSTYFYGGKKVMNERFINIFDSKKKHRGIPAFCILLLAVCAAGGLVACQDVKAAMQNKIESSVSDTAASSDTKTDSTTTTLAANSAKSNATTAKTAAATRLNSDGVTQKTKEYILKGQNNKSEAQTLKWSETFLNQVNIEAVYQKYLTSGGQSNDIAGFAEYLTKNAPIPGNWKELFESDLSKTYGEKASRYEPLQNDLYQVYVKMNGSEVPYVVVNPRTGYFHG